MPANAIFEGPAEPALLNFSFADLLAARSERYGNSDAVASLHQNTRRTYRDLRDRVNAIATQLLEHGVLPGDRVILFSGNCIEFVEIFLAVTSVGAIAVLVAPALAFNEVQDAIRSVDPKLLFIAQKIGYRSNTDLIRWAGTLEKSITISLGSTTPQSLLGEGIRSFEEFLTKPTVTTCPEGAPDSHASLQKVWADIKASDPCCFQFTSGTTGPRKAAMLSHSNLINNANFIGHRLQLSPRDIVCCAPPLSHCFGLVATFLASLLHGGVLIIPSEIFNPMLVLKSLRDEGCTIINAVPSMFEALLKQEQKRQRNGSGAPTTEYKLRSGIIAGSTPPQDLLRALKSQFNLENLLYPFGMTELSAVCVCTTLDHSLLQDNSSVGTALPHTSIKVVDEQGDIVPVNVPGELCVSGYLVFLGYFRNEMKTKEAFQIDDAGKTWLRTGDIVKLDTSGRCMVIGRSKDMIKKHGENIAPKDIEDILNAQELVKTSAVVGVPNEKHGESVVAFVELNDRGTELNERQLKSWLREQGLAPYKMPDSFVAVGNVEGGLEEFPLNASGKILKTDLRHFATTHLLVN